LVVKRCAAKRGGARVAAVVLGHDLDLLAQYAALGVLLLGQQFDDFLHALAFAGPGAGQRRHQADLDGIGRLHGAAGDQTDRCGQAPIVSVS
jgi:hypothetical protein